LAETVAFGTNPSFSVIIVIIPGYSRTDLGYDPFTYTDVHPYGPYPSRTLRIVFTRPLCLDLFYGKINRWF
jgi:hypothetical protein